ncbi:MAG: DUF4124 domain-containing protein [Betaproteobacteria bacterium]|nr:MAG: DUF4124 domain-containing protein [Betaproteobacteria bacterium]
MAFTAYLSVARWCVCATCWCAALTFAAATNAEICKYIDLEGNVHYTNVAPEKGWKKLSCGVGEETGRSSAGKASPTPAAFPKVDADTQKTRDDVRRRVLKDELVTEEKLLAEARVAYGDGAPKPLAEEQADAQKYADRLSRLRQAVSLHEKNIEALRKELAALR